MSTPEFDSPTDGLLTETDIRGYEFPGSTIILSGCRTATDYGSKNRNGVTGLSLAFLTQGAKNLLVTQWKIPDNTSSDVVTGIVKRWSEKISAHTLKDELTVQKSSNNEPYNWASYILISTPSRYNNTRPSSSNLPSNTNFKVEKDTILPSTKINGNSFYIGLSNLGNEDSTFEIYKKIGTKFRLISSFDGLQARFIGPKNMNFLFIESKEALWIAELNSAMSKIIKKIKILDASNTFVQNYTLPFYHDDNFLFSHNAFDSNSGDFSVHLTKISKDLKETKKTDITHSILQFNYPNHYKGDSLWRLNYSNEGLHLAISRNFQTSYYDKRTMAWDFKIVPNTYIYNYDDDFNFTSAYALPNSKLLDNVLFMNNSFFVADGDKRNLSIIDNKARILNKFDEISNINILSQQQSNDNNYVFIQSMVNYSNHHYQDIFNVSNELIDFEPTKYDQKVSLQEQIINDTELEVKNFTMKDFYQMKSSFVSYIFKFNEYDSSLIYTSPSSVASIHPVAIFEEERNQFILKFIMMIELRLGPYSP